MTCLGKLRNWNYFLQRCDKVHSYFTNILTSSTDSPEVSISDNKSSENDLIKKYGLKDLTINITKLSESEINFYQKSNDSNDISVRKVESEKIGDLVETRMQITPESNMISSIKSTHSDSNIEVIDISDDDEEEKFIPPSKSKLKSEIKPNINKTSEVKPAIIKSEVKPAIIKTEIKPVTKTEIKPVTKSEIKPVVQSVKKSVIKTIEKTEEKLHLKKESVIERKAENDSTKTMNELRSRLIVKLNTRFSKHTSSIKEGKESTKNFSKQKSLIPTINEGTSDSDKHDSTDKDWSETSIESDDTSDHSSSKF